MNHVRDSRFTYVYVLCSDKSSKWYVGCTNDLRERLAEHQSNRGGYTKGRGPFSLIYYEACRTSDDAYTREKYLKTGMGRRYLRNRLKRFLSLT
jgi:putative endonuclease